jgi:hypothetical protein
MAITDARLFGLSEAELGPERCGDVERARLREVEKRSARRSQGTVLLVAGMRVDIGETLGSRAPAWRSAAMVTTLTTTTDTRRIAPTSRP